MTSFFSKCPDTIIGFLDYKLDYWIILGFLWIIGFFGGFLRVTGLFPDFWILCDFWIKSLDFSGSVRDFC